MVRSYKYSSTLNRTILNHIKNITARKAFLGKKPAIKHLKVFLCTAVMYLDL